MTFIIMAFPPAFPKETVRQIGSILGWNRSQHGDSGPMAWLSGLAEQAEWRLDVA